MKVLIEKINKYREVKSNTIKNILKELNINPTTVIISVNNELVLDKKVSKKDKVIIHSVISGG